MSIISPLIKTAVGVAILLLTCLVMYVILGAVVALADVFSMTPIRVVANIFLLTCSIGISYMMGDGILQQ